MNEKLKNIIEQLKSITLLETVELVTEIEKIFGLETLITIGNISPIQTAEAPIIVVEEKTSFDVTLIEVPSDKKIAILKVVRNITGLGLKESKDVVDNVPKIIKEGITKEESETIKKELENAGGKVIIN